MANRMALVIDGVVDVISITGRRDEDPAWVVVGDDVFSGFISNGEGTFSAPPVPPISTEQVNEERDRRIELPKAVSLSTGKSFGVDIANGGRQNIGDMSTAALVKQSSGDNTDFAFTDADNVDQTLTNAEMIEVGMHCVAQISAIHHAARTLKELSPIPSLFTDDTHWP